MKRVFEGYVTNNPPGTGVAEGLQLITDVSACMFTEFLNKWVQVTIESSDTN